MASESTKKAKKDMDVIGKAIRSAGKTVDRLLTLSEKSERTNEDSVRPEISVGTTVSLSADAHRHGGGGGVLKEGETGIVVALEPDNKARFYPFSVFELIRGLIFFINRVRSQTGNEHVYETLALKAYARTSRAASMLVESVYFPALAAMLFDACTTNSSLKAVLLKQAAAYAKSLRPLELFGESTCHESVERVVEFLFNIIRDGNSQSGWTEDAKVAFESLIALAAAEGSVARNLQLALVACTHPSLIEPRHLKSLRLLAEGISAGEEAPSVRASAFSAALDTALQAGKACTPVQACAAVMAQVELLLGEAEHARKHRGKVPVPHISEVNALRALIDFIDFVGGSKGALDSPDLAWSTATRGQGSSRIQEQAALAHAARREVVPGCGTTAEEGVSAEEACSDSASLAIIFNSAMRLLAANLALSIHLDDALESDPVETLERVRCLLRAVIASGANSDFFGALTSDDRKAVREVALAAYDYGGEAFFKDMTVMAQSAQVILNGVLPNNPAPETSDDTALDIAVLKILARPPILLPMLLSDKEDVRGKMVEIVDNVAAIHFNKLGQEADVPGSEAAPSSNFETVDADWNWGLCHRDSIQLSKDDRRVYKSNSSPDYSCAMSSEPFTEGVHSWEVLFESTCSTWVGIAGESTKDYLGSSPVIQYGATLHNGGSWNLYGGLNSTKQESASFCGGTRVSMVLDFDQGIFDMYVDGEHKLSANNIEPNKPLHAYVCMDGSGECFELTSATKQTVSSKCNTLLDAVKLVGNTIVRLETGILSNPVSEKLSEHYGLRFLEKFSSRLESLGADLKSGAVQVSTVLDALSTNAAQICFENMIAMTIQLCTSPILQGNFSPLNRVVKAACVISIDCALDDDHWLNQYIRTLLAVLGPEVASVIWGDTSAETEGEREEWFSSKLFSKGLLTSPLHTELLLEQDQPSLFDKMLQPRIAVLTSPYLDYLERSVIIAILYHVGVVDQVISLGSESSEELVATCQNAAMVARQVRRHVMEIRNLANQGLAENEKPQDWDFFVKPFVDKCRLLLQVASLCPTQRPASATSQRKIVAAALLVKQRSGKPEKQHSEWDKVLTSVQAAKVYSRMHSQTMASTPQSKAVVIITKFLKDGDVLASTLRKKLEVSLGSLSPGLKSCSSFDALIGIIDLRNASILHLTLSALFQTRKNSTSSPSATVTSSASAPDDWGTSVVSRVEASSNSSDASKVTDGDSNTFWQSNGSCPHWIKLNIEEGAYSKVGILVSSQDGSYCPASVHVLVGTEENDLTEIGSQELQVNDLQNFTFEITDGGPISLIKIRIDRNQSGGCDTRVRGVFLNKKGGSIGKEIWIDDGKDCCHRKHHYLKSARESNEPELRERFNKCTKALIELVSTEIKNPKNPICGSALQFLSMKMDRNDLDFLAGSSIGSLLENIRSEFEAEISTASKQGAVLELDFVHNFASFGKFLKAAIEQVERLDAEANPIYCKTIVDAIFSAISKATLQLKIVATADAKTHLDEFASLLLTAVCKFSTTSVVLASLSSLEWQDLLWCLAASDIQEGARLAALQLIRSLVLSRKSGLSLEELADRVMNMISFSSPELAVFGQDSDKASPNLTVRAEAISLVNAMLDAPWAKQQVMDAFTNAIKEPANSKKFLAAIIAFGGRLDLQQRDYDRSLASTAYEGSLLNQQSVSLILENTEPLISRVQALSVDKEVGTKEELSSIVASTRAVKALWELFPAWQDKYVARSALVSDLIKLANAPCPVPYSCVQTNGGGAGSAASWTWGPCEPNNIMILDNGLTAKNRSGSGPDYSCALGTETFFRGSHTWEIEVQNVNSMWLGIARGVQEAGGLGYSPGQHGEFQLYFGSGGGWGHRGSTPNVETISSGNFGSGHKVKLELDIDAKSLTMSVNGDVKYICHDVDCAAGVVPYMCSDYTESATIISRTSSLAQSPILSMDMLVSKTHGVLPILRGASNAGKSSMEDFLRDLELNSPEIIATTLKKLQDAGITVEELCSASLNGDRLESAGVPLGPRKAILEKRDKELAGFALRPSLQKARALARMCQPVLPLSACVKALAEFDESGDFENLAKSIQERLSISDKVLEASEKLCKQVGSERFVKDGVPRAPSGVSTQPPSKPVVWATRGSELHLAIDVERALLTHMSRLLVYDLLATGFSNGIDAPTLEQLLNRNFESVEHTRPRFLSNSITVQHIERILTRSVLGWMKSAPADEISKLKTLSMTALDRYLALQTSREDSSESAGDLPPPPKSEEDNVQSGIGFSLVVLASLVEAKQPVSDLTEKFAKCILLSSADSCPDLLGALCSALNGLDDSFEFGKEMQKALQIIRNAIVAMIKKEQPKIRAGVHHSTHVLSLQDSVSRLELMSANCFDDNGRLKWGFSGEISQEFKVLFQDDIAVGQALASSNVSSFQKLLELDEDVLDGLPLSTAQQEILKALKQRDSRFFFLPGDTVQMTSLASFSLEAFIDKLSLSSPEVVSDTVRNLRNGNLTTTDLLSPSMTADRLKSLGIPLGPRKAIIEQRDKAKSSFTIVTIRKNGTYEVKNDASETSDAHYVQLSFVENGKVASSLGELGFIDRDIIFSALITLKLEAFDAGLDTSDGQKIIDYLTSSPNKITTNSSDDSEANNEDNKARQKIEDYTKVFAALQSMRNQKPFTAAFQDSVKCAFDAPKECEASWTWGPHEPTDISITEEGLKATKNYVTGPDYSCAIGSESFEEGIHTWEIEVNNTKQTSYSMWLGIARGMEEAGQLGQYPSNGICNYMIAFGCGGGDVRLSGKEPIIENISSYQYSSGQRVKFELDMNEHTLQVSVDGNLALIARNVDDQGVRPYVCMDYSESAFIVSRTCTRRKGAEDSTPLVSVISADDVSVALNNSLWTEDIDSALVRLSFAGKVTLYDEATMDELRPCIEKIGGKLESLSLGSVAARLNVHAVLKKMLLRAMPLINLDSDKNQNHLFEELQKSQSRISVSTFANIFESAVQIAQGRNTGNFPSVSANRGTVPAEQRKKEKTVFYQIFQQIGTGSSKASLNGYSSNDAGKQFWKMSFQGEGGIDAGGLFRDSVREICAELQSEGSLKLLLPYPNQKRMGSGQARWIVNPALGDKKSLEMYQFIGTIMGASLLWQASVELDLPGLVWKQLIGQKANWADLVAVDETFCRKIIESRTVTEAEWVAGQQKWVVVTSSGRLAELRRGGANLVVPFSEKDEYLDACVEYRLSEGRKQIEAMRAGFFGLVPTLGLQFLDWHQVEKLVCGTPVIDIALLKKITSYNNMSGNENHPVAIMFWNVMESFTNEERAQVMAFAWGRRRMPPQMGGVHFKMCVDSGLDDRHMPRSHTCFFAIDLPRYTNEETMRKKLLYAATYCSAIDNDSSANGQLYADDGYDVALDEDLTDAVLPFESDVAAAAVAAPADGGHAAFRKAGSKARATKPGGKKAVCTIVGPLPSRGEWDTSPELYRVRWSDSNEVEEVADDNVEEVN